MGEAQTARVRANESGAMKEATRADEQYIKAWQARLAAASLSEQSRLHAAMTRCIDSYSNQRIRRAAQATPQKP